MFKRDVYENGKQYLSKENSWEAIEKKWRHYKILNTREEWLKSNDEGYGVKEFVFNMKCN